MMKSKKYLMLFVAAGLVACASDEPKTPVTQTPDTEQETEKPDTDNQEDTSDSELDENELAEFPEQIEETIEIEGMEETIVMERYHNSEAQFLTYVPEDFVIEEQDSVEGESYQFIVNYDGERNDDINLEVFLFGDDVTEEPTLEDENSDFVERMQGMEEIDENQKLFDWSLREYHTEDETVHAMLGEHEGEYFLVTINSDPLYSEGFIPRVNKILDHFYWTETETYLMDRS